MAACEVPPVCRGEVREVVKNAAAHWNLPEAIQAAVRQAGDKLFQGPADHPEQVVAPAHTEAVDRARENDIRND